MRTIVTSYPGTDIDGLAASVGYAEYLQKTGKQAKAVVFGRPNPEARYVLANVDVNLEDGRDVLTSEDAVALVDVSADRYVPDQVDPAQVTTVIDHRKDTRLDDFPAAECQVELVGAAATLIAERFYEQHLDISHSAAVLLYAAIYANTVNLQADVTTDRDRAMADWLGDQCKLREDFVRDMFRERSSFDEPVKDVFAEELVVFEESGQTVGITQLELLEVNAFLAEHRQQIEDALTDIQREHELGYLLCIAVDISDGFTAIIAREEQTQRLLGEVIEEPFSDGLAHLDRILLRKQLLPLLRDALEQQRS